MQQQNKRQRAFSRGQEQNLTKTSEGAHMSVKVPLSFNFGHLLLDISGPPITFYRCKELALLLCQDRRKLVLF